MLTIAGIEATQAIQVFRSTFPVCSSGGQPAPCPDNSVPLVAGRRTTLRVYVEGAPAGSRVGAIATHGYPPQTPLATYLFRVGTEIDAPPSPFARTDPSQTVQIDLPETQAGTWTLDVLALARIGNSYVASATSSVTLTFVERRTVRLRLVRIHYTGRGLDLAEPSASDFWSAAGYAKQVLPVPDPGFQIVGDTVEAYDGDFTRIDPGAHDATWPGYAANRGTTGNLLNIMDRVVASESLPGDVIYLGLYPAAARQAAYAGWAVGRWILTDLNPETIAHEVAHHVGAPMHAPCGGPAYVDPNYPVYGSFPSASIGEVGWDSRSGTTKDPATTYDLMSYCGPKWISPHNFRRTFDGLLPLPPETKAPPLFTLPNKVHVAVLRFPDRWTKVEIPAFPRPLPPWPPGPPIGSTSGAFRLIDDAGAVLSETPGSLVDQVEGGDGLPQMVLGELEWDDGAVRIDYLDDRGEPVVREELGREPPGLRVEWPRGDDGSPTVRWRVEDPDEVWVSVRGSADGGRTWLATTRPAAAGAVELGELFPAGGSLLLEAVAVRGGRATVIPGVQVRLRRRSDHLLVLDPPDGTRLMAGDPIRLEAVPARGGRGPGDIRWHSDLDGEIGAGGDCLVRHLSAGSHRIEARAAWGRTSEPLTLDVSPPRAPAEPHSR